MASIKGIEAKGFRYIDGIDGSGFSMNLYLGGTRIARCINDGSGGMTEIAWDGSGFREAAKEIVSQYYKERPKHISCDGEMQDFVTELSELSELQALYKKGLKKGYAALVRVLHNKRTTTPEERDYGKRDVVLQSRTWSKQDEEAIGLKYQPIELEVYTNTEAFHLK